MPASPPRRRKHALARRDADTASHPVR